MYNPVHNTALAFCDPTRLKSQDIVAADRVSPEYVGEIYYLRHRDGQRWYWLSGQEPSEALFFTSYDSDLDFNRACEQQHSKYII